MPHYTSALLRHVPDPARMEPLNIGVFVQDGQDAVYRINGRFVPGAEVKPDFDRANFREWRRFFRSEMTGDQH